MKVTTKIWIFSLVCFHAGIIGTAIIIPAVPYGQAVGEGLKLYRLDYSGHWPWLLGFIAVALLGLLCAAAVLAYDIRQKRRAAPKA